jgi:hypothetical protein
MKTAIKLTVTDSEGKSLAPFFRVKLDRERKPYIVVSNKKYFITHAKFPREFSVDFGYTTLLADIKEGLPELIKLLENAAS